MSDCVGTAHIKKVVNGFNRKGSEDVKRDYKDLRKVAMGVLHNELCCKLHKERFGKLFFIKQVSHLSNAIKEQEAKWKIDHAMEERVTECSVATFNRNRKSMIEDCAIEIVAHMHWLHRTRDRVAKRQRDEG